MMNRTDYEMMTRLASRASYWNSEGRTAPEYITEAHEFAASVGVTEEQVSDLMEAAYRTRMFSEDRYLTASSAILAA